MLDVVDEVLVEVVVVVVVLVVLEEVELEEELDELELVVPWEVDTPPQAVADTKSMIANSNAMIFFTFLTSFQKGCCSLKFCRILSYYSRF